MWNYLYEIIETGERIFVQCDKPSEVEGIMRTWGISLHELEYIDKFTDEEAEILGYDTY